MIDRIEIELGEKYGCLATIHLDPLDLNCEVTNSLKELLSGVLKDIDPVLAFHDFRTVTGPTHTNMIFDVVLPFDHPMTADEVKEKIISAVKAKRANCYCVIVVDRG